MNHSKIAKHRAAALARRFLAAAMGLLTGNALATETVTYTYDTKGAVKEVRTTDGVNNGVKHTYQYDKSKNKTQSQTTGSPNASPPP